MMYTPDDIFRILDEEGVWWHLDNHEAVFDMAALGSVSLTYPEAEAKNLFLRDDRKKYYLFVVKGDKRVNLKAVRKSLALRPLSFASTEELEAVLGLEKGAVTPFGLLNDTQHRTKCFIDEDFLPGEGLIGVHPLTNRATVVMKADDFLAVLKNSGADVKAVEFVFDEEQDR